MKRLLLSFVIVCLFFLRTSDSCTIILEDIVPPTNLIRTAYSASPRQITLSWQDNASDETGYIVEVSVDGGVTWSLETETAHWFSPNTTSAVIPLDEGDRFPYFRVSTERVEGAVSYPSNVISVEGTDPTISDTDSDGMIDAFEVTNGLDPYINDAYKDQDGDRYPNIFEYIHGSDIIDPESIPMPSFIVDPNATQQNNIFSTIQSALGAVDEDFQIVLIKDGQFSGSGNHSLEISEDHPVLLLSEHGAGKTSIDGNGAYQCLKITNSSVVDGLTFKNGHAVSGGALQIVDGSPILVNCVFLNNTATSTGGAIKQDAGNSLFLHCTIRGGVADQGGNAIAASSGAVTILKSIIWTDSPFSVTNLTISDSIVKGGYLGSGNLSSDPMLTPDAHLTLGSPAIDKGDVLLTSLLDMDGEIRPVGTTTDLGADEFVDTDSDGLPDWWEIMYFGGLTALGATDSDNDGLTNLQECLHGTSPLNSDSDGDGLPDGWEVAGGLNPLSNADAALDSDGDGLTNFQEYRLRRKPNQAELRAKVCSGNSFSLVLKENGTVWAWGANSSGCLGDGSTINRVEPVQSTGLSSIIDIAIGNTHSLALKADGTVWAWGDSSNGKLGIGSSGNQSVAVQVPISDVVAIAAAGDSSYALKLDGTVWAWGKNNTSQLGDGTSVNKSLPIQIVGLIDITSIAAGGTHAMALAGDGLVYGWGANTYGQIGDNTKTARSTPILISTISEIKSIAAGERHSIALKSDGSIFVWGNNGFGQLADGTKTERLVPTTLTGITGAKAIFAGGVMSGAIDATDKCYIWGNMSLGIRPSGSADIPNLISELQGARSMSRSDRQSAIVTNDGRIVVFGLQLYGNIIDNIVDYLTPTWNGAISKARSVSASPEFYSILKDDGSVWEWGLSPTQKTSNLLASYGAVEIPGLENIVQIANGVDFSLALNEDGEVWSWGTGAGAGRVTPNTTPGKIVGLSDIVHISAGQTYAVALTRTGNVWAWGGGPGANQTIPVQVSGLNDIVKIDAGKDHVMAVKSDGSVWGWGRNDLGQLGDGTNTNRNSPVSLPLWGSVISIRASIYYSIAIKSNGEVVGSGWGMTGAVQTYASRITTPGLLYFDDVSIAEPGYFDSFFINTDGELFRQGQGFDAGPMDDLIHVFNTIGVKDIDAPDKFGVYLQEDGSVWCWGGATTIGPYFPIWSLPGHLRDFKAILSFSVFEDSISPVSLEVPEDLALLVQGNSIEISLSDSPGSLVDSVEFYAEDTLIEKVTEGPWEIGWVPPTWGRFRITAITYDGEGLPLHKVSEEIIIPYDSDEDGLPDWWEVTNLGGLGSGPTDDDDGDGLSNNQERLLGTNPNSADTDGDGVSDSVEIAQGRNPLKGAVSDVNGNVSLEVFTIFE